MHRTIRTILLIVFLGYQGAALFAQDMLIKPFTPYNFLLKEDSLYPIPVTEPTRNPFEPNRIERDLINNSEDLFGNYLQWPRFNSPPMEEALRKQQQVCERAADRTVFCALYNKPRQDEEKMIRKEWEKVFGTDIWYPYYKAKEVEHWVKEKCSVRIFKLKGTPRFEKHEVIYVFKTKF